jgi:hypothetical protein
MKLQNRLLFTLHFKSDTFNLQGINRHIQARIDETLSLFPCVALLGVRQCDWFYKMIEIFEQRSHSYQLVQSKKLDL